MIILLAFNCSFVCLSVCFQLSPDFSDSFMTLEIRSARVFLTIVFCCRFLTSNKPNNALGACSWNFLVLNAPMFSSPHFECESGNSDQWLLLKHKMVPEFSQSPPQTPPPHPPPRQSKPSVQLKLRLQKYTTIGEFRIQFCILVATVNHCFRFRFHF